MIKKCIVAFGWSWCVLGNEFVVEKPVVKSHKKVSCSQLKEDIIQSAADLLVVATDAVHDQVTVLKKKGAKKYIDHCAQILDDIATVQGDLLCMMSNIISPEKKSIWCSLTRQQLTDMREAVTQHAGEAAVSGCFTDDASGVVAQVLKKKKTWWHDTATAIHACLPCEEQKTEK